MYLILATGPRAAIEGASKLLDALGGFGAVGWWELERRQFKLEAYAYSLESAQLGVGAIALSDPDLDARLAPLEDADWVKMSLEGLPPVPAGRYTPIQWRRSNSESRGARSAPARKGCERGR